MNGRFDFATLCRDKGIRIALPGERHYRNGWVCLPCPFCVGQEGNHLGFNPTSNVFTCFRCGRHGKYSVVAALLGVQKKAAYELAKVYTDKWGINREKNEPAPLVHAKKEDFALPGKRTPSKMHEQYLQGRGFAAADIIRDWDIRFCDIVGRYSYRIIIPITYKNRIVTFTTRDVTGEAKDRYLACPPDEALRHHKHCVYGIDRSPFGKTCVIVEGPVGVWRIGKGSGATMGTGWTQEQAKIISKFQKSYIFFDPGEVEAHERAESLASLLSSYRDHRSFVITADNHQGRDTGELTPAEVREIRRVLK